MRYICTSIVAMLILAGTSFAATFNVPADYATIQEAVDAASDNDEILVQPGTYTGTGTYEAVNLNSRQVILRSTDGRDSTFISGEDVRRAIACGVAGTVIDGFTLMDGNATSNGGGAIICSGDVTIMNCRISNNRVSSGDDGGGIKFVGGSPQLIDCLIENNTTTRNGGGIYLNGGSDTTITDCILESNISQGAGGAIYCQDQGVLTMANCVMTDNESSGMPGGGGVCTVNSQSVFTNCTFSENSAPEAGALRLESSSDSVLNNCTFSHNSATIHAGAIYAHKSSASFADCIFTDNTAAHNAGAINTYIKDVFVDACFFGNNSATTGGAFYINSNNTYVSNTIFCNNTPGHVEGSLASDEDNHYLDDCAGAGDDDGDGVFDHIDNCYLYNPDQADCNENGVGDVCDIADFTSFDCDENGVPDECQPDCDGDGWIDPCDNEGDIDGDGIPDNCEDDCNDNGMPDETELENGWATDCNGNGIPDECDIADGSALDCNGNNVPDTCDLADGTAQDCNDNGAPDSCDLLNAAGWSQEQKILAEDAADEDWFGVSVSMSANIAVVGATGDDDLGITSGSAYVYERDESGNWIQTAKLTASDGEIGDFFGISVSVHGTTALVGAYENNNDDFSGSAYVYSRQIDGTWSESAKITPEDGNSGDEFGYSVSIHGSTAVVGAPSHDNSYPNSGAIYVFHNSGTQWNQIQKLVPNDGATDSDDQFGTSVQIADGLIVAGAPMDDAVGANSGSSYLFRLNGSEWSQEAQLLPTKGQAGDKFGRSVAIDGETVLIGSPFHQDNGAGFVYRLVNGEWIEEATLLPDETSNETTFGFSTSVSGRTAVIGRKGEGGTYGGAYVFTYDGTEWVDSESFLAGDSNINDYFGHAVSVDNQTLLIGAWGDDDNGDDDSGTAIGSAYFFTSVSTDDCDGNGILDSCELEDDPSLDCNSDGALDNCQLIEDCNANDIPDECDIADGVSNDINSNGIPDECEDDCNENGVPDYWDIKTGTSEDCNANGIPDECDTADGGGSNDVNGNSIPDECEEDCNGNGSPDDWDLVTGWSEDCNGNLIPDECELSEGKSPAEGAVQWTVAEGGNGHWYQLVEDDDEGWNACRDAALAVGGDLCSHDTQIEDDFISTLIPFEGSGDGLNRVYTGAIQSEEGGWSWIDGSSWAYTNWHTGQPNGGEYYLSVSNWKNEGFGWDDHPENHSDINFYLIEWDLGSFSLDCNTNGVPDECDIADETSEDINGDGVPDECQCLADIDGSGAVAIDDILAVSGYWGTSNPAADLNGNGIVDIQDLLIVISEWGPCP